MATPAHDAAAVVRPDAPDRARAMPSVPAAVDAITQTDRDKLRRHPASDEAARTSARPSRDDAEGASCEAVVPGAATGAGRAGSVGNTTGMGGTGANDDASASAPVRGAEDRPHR
jgi:hypothetical protein